MQFPRVNRNKAALWTVLIASIGSSTVVHAWAQSPPQPAPSTSAPAARPRRGPASAFPERPPSDAAAVERGKALYGVHCNFCHGSDARGGEGGPNLLRSELVLNDQSGELIGPVVRNGRPGMPRFDLTPAQISDVAAYIHNFKVGGYDESRMVPPSIVVGDPKAGAAFFQKTCSGCHSVTGDLKGIASRIPDAKRLQQTWLMPSPFRGFGGPPAASKIPPTTVTVTTPSGSKVEGRLTHIDDFSVTLIDSEGAQRTFTRQGDVPKVEVHDPLEPHRELLRTYSDKEIHDVTAYLVTVK
jgi:cytochrome c oxidase cbb3-type subunit III